jgi:signal transduction histidine kinase
VEGPATKSCRFRFVLGGVPLSTDSKREDGANRFSSDCGHASTSRIRAAKLAGKPLRVLLVEDSDDDEILLLHELRRGGYAPQVTRTQSSRGFIAALEEESPDVIISDHTVPGYGGLMALADLKASGKDIPFILVSGTVGESVAVAAMRAGAHDYVLKGDLSRLPMAVEREVLDCQVRAERTRMRERLLLSERLVSVGTLAAGVAHEINNPLAIAMSNLECVLEGLAPGPDPLGPRVLAYAEPLRDIDEALKRIRDIVRDVKLFSRPQASETTAVDVRSVIDSSVRMAFKEIRHRVRVVKEFGAVPLVTANESRLGQVVLNLIVNAAHAVPEGRADDNPLRLITRTLGDGRAVIEVADTGCGIPKEHLERIFDPFFTTKPAGVGTGLGLSICHTIVAELGGEIEVDSEVGQGTTFRVILPPAGAVDADRAVAS